VYSTRKSLKDFGDKVDGAARGNIENATGDLEEAIKGDDVDLIKKRPKRCKRRPTSCRSSVPGGAGAARRPRRFRRFGRRRRWRRRRDGRG